MKLPNVRNLLKVPTNLDLVKNIKRDDGFHKGRRIVYVGSFLDEAIVTERGLTSHNAAGSNRINRVSQALRAGGYRPVIISPAASLRMKSFGKLLHVGRLRRSQGASVIFAPVIGIFGFNIFSSFFFQLLTLKRTLESGKVCGVIIYNFNPSMVVICAYIKWIWRLPIINNIEDVSVPTLSDWSPRAEARPLQQIIFSVCMNLVAKMSDAYIVPAKRFLGYLPSNIPAIVVTGCISGEDNPRVNFLRKDEIPVVLYAGKLEREHGIVEFVRALQRIDHTENLSRLKVCISGSGRMSEWVRQEIAGIKSFDVVFYGFLSKAEYSDLLNSSHICVAFQDPSGRYGNYKTPSKVYEFLGHGKAVIATAVGDIRDVPRESILIIDQLDVENIVNCLLWLSSDSSRVATMQLSAKQYSEQYFSYKAVGGLLRQLISNVQGQPR